MISMFSCLSASRSLWMADVDEALGADDDALLWSRDLDRHSHGEFSIAMVQANKIIEDHSEVVSNEYATFVGVYDGHGGHDASKYVADNLFRNLNRLAQGSGVISQDIIKTAFAQTEDGFITTVREAYSSDPLIAAAGSCCLVGVIWKRTLYVANLGDSRAVIGYLDRRSKTGVDQLTKDHNAREKEVRDELKQSHPGDPDIVVKSGGDWRIKDVIEVSRAIGDAYLKSQEFELLPACLRFYLGEPILQPVIRADPAIITRQLLPRDRFLIFASAGLWEFLTNEEAVKIVHSNPRQGIAKRLLVSALVKAGQRSNPYREIKKPGQTRSNPYREIKKPGQTRIIPYREIKKLGQGARRQFHKDIAVIVVFIDDAETMPNNNNPAPDVYVRGFIDAIEPSNFNFQPASPQPASPQPASP